MFIDQIDQLVDGELCKYMPEKLPKSWAKMLHLEVSLKLCDNQIMYWADKYSITEADVFALKGRLLRFYGYKLAPGPRLTAQYREWRKQVLKRDKYICQKCGQKSGKLCAHHIENFRDNPGLRTELSNGVTLCKNCHKDYHHQYGIRGNTKIQFMFWLGKLS